MYMFFATSTNHLIATVIWCLYLFLTFFKYFYERKKPKRKFPHFRKNRKTKIKDLIYIFL